MKTLIFVAAAALALTACNAPAPANETEQQVIDNATDAYDNSVEDADTRADRLDDQGEALDATAGQVGGKSGSALRNEANSDFGEAADLRSQGQTQGASREDAIETKDGLINQQ